MQLLERLIRHPAAGLSAIGWLLTPGAAFGQLLINPVIVELGARQRAAVVTVTLGAKAGGPVRLQSQVLRWEQAIDGSPRNHPSNELVVSPPITELRPGDSQVFRVALRGPRRQPAELAYRLIFEDTSAPAAASSSGVSFRLRYDLPVLVGAAEAPRAALRWRSCAAPAADLCVRLSNDGNRRITFATLAIIGSDGRLAIDKPGTVLAGGEREWRGAPAVGQSGTALRVSATTRAGETIDAALQVP